jgi:hypothetical protein
MVRLRHGPVRVPVRVCLGSVFILINPDRTGLRARKFAKMRLIRQEPAKTK